MSNCSQLHEAERDAKHAIYLARLCGSGCPRFLPSPHWAIASFCLRRDEVASEAGDGLASQSPLLARPPSVTHLPLKGN